MANPVNQHRVKVEESLGIGKRAANKRAAKGTDTEAAISDSARKEKATADLRERQAERAQVELDKARGKLIEREQSQRDGEWLATLVMSAWDSFASDWPGQFAGLSEIQVRQEVLKERERFVSHLKAEIAKL